MYLIGLTGGIASGKSTIARRLAERGAVHIDADLLARVAVEPGSPALAAVVERFGPGVLNDDGSLNRAELGGIVFSDPEALQSLNAIVHPAVRELTARRIASAEQADPDAVIVYDVPLLVEAQVPHAFDLVVVASAAPDTRISRLVGMRGMSAEEARRRIASQASDDERLAVADRVIDTDGTIAATVELADAIWELARSASSR